MNTVFMTQPPGTPSFQIACPIGKRIRIIAITAALLTVSGGDQLQVQYRRDQTAFHIAFLNPLQGTEIAISAAIGANVNQPLLSVIDPVTGVLTFLNVTGQNVALMDVWFELDIVMVIATTSGTTFGVSRVAYQIDTLN